MLRRAFGSAVVVCVFLPGVANAQPRVGVGVGVGHYPYGPRIAPPWGYYGLSGGPFVGYPPPGTPGYPAFAYPHNFPDSGHKLSLHRPLVPVYGPLPAVQADDHHRWWRSTVTPGLAGYGWLGIYNINPRPRPRTVSTRSVAEGLSAAPGASATNAGGCLVLSVKVPHSAAEVFVDGTKTQQTGTDRTFESPPVEPGKNYAYTVTARWVEGGQVVEVSRVVSGAPGETVRVDFAAPAVAMGK